MLKIGHHDVDQNDDEDENDHNVDQNDDENENDHDVDQNDDENENDYDVEKTKLQINIWKFRTNKSYTISQIKSVDFNV